MFTPDPDLLKISRELEDTMRLTQGGALELDGSRESVVKGVLLLQCVIAMYEKKHGHLPRFLVADPPPAIPPAALAKARLFPNREEMLSLWPQNATVCEIGTAYGVFAKEIMARTNPSRFHIIDQNMGFLDRAPFTADIASGRIVLHESLSHAAIASFPHDYFDVAYIDGGHSYDIVAGDIVHLLPRVKKGGLLVFNDYTPWSPLEGLPYGVMVAVNQLLQDPAFEVAGFALHHWGYHDIAVRKLTD